MRGPKLIAVVAQKKLNTEPVTKITKAKVKKEKDPGPPKRPPSAFFVFMVEFRKDFKENFPDNKSVVVAKEGAAKWKAMSESEKAPYVEKAASKKAEYAAALKLHNIELAEAKEKSASTSKSSSEVHDDAEEVASSQEKLKRMGDSLLPKGSDKKFDYEKMTGSHLPKESDKKFDEMLNRMADSRLLKGSDKIVDERAFNALPVSRLKESDKKFDEMLNRMADSRLPKGSDKIIDERVFNALPVSRDVDQVRLQLSREKVAVVEFNNKRFYKF